MAKDYHLAFRRLRAIVEEHNACVSVEDLEQLSLSKDAPYKVLWIAFDPGTQVEVMHRTLSSIAANWGLLLIAFRVGLSDYLHYVPNMDAFYRISKVIPQALPSYGELTRFRIMKRDLDKEIVRLNAQHKRRHKKDKI